MARHNVDADNNPDYRTCLRVARPPHEYDLTLMQDLTLIAQATQTIFEKYCRRLEQVCTEHDETATYAIKDVCPGVYPGANVFFRLDNLAAHIGQWIDFVYTMHEMWRQNTRRGWAGLVAGFSGPDASQQFLLELVSLERGLKRVELAIHGPLWTLNQLSSWTGGYTIFAVIESLVRV